MKRKTYIGQGQDESCSETVPWHVQFLLRVVFLGAWHLFCETYFLSLVANLLLVVWVKIDKDCSVSGPCDSRMRYLSPFLCHSWELWMKMMNMKVAVSDVYKTFFLTFDFCPFPFVPPILIDIHIPLSIVTWSIQHRPYNPKWVRLRHVRLHTQLPLILTTLTSSAWSLSHLSFSVDIFHPSSCNTCSPVNFISPTPRPHN